VYVACGNIVAADVVSAPGMPTTGNASQNMTFGAMAILALVMTVLGFRLVRRKA
jgi:LPXTG-motif cell wall-anchored protein